MKKSFTLVVGNITFPLYEDAYYALRGYFEDISARLSVEERDGVMEEVAFRTAELLQEARQFPTQIITLDMVFKVVQIIGSADAFGEETSSEEFSRSFKESGEGFTDEMRNILKNRLYRSRTDRVFFGVCGGIAAYLNIDPTIVRLLFIIFLFMAGSSIIVYIVMAIVVPLESLEAGQRRTMENPNGV